MAIHKVKLGQVVGPAPNVRAEAGQHIGVSGTPAVSVETSQDGKTATLVFNYLKGEKGDNGANGANGVTPTLYCANGDHINEVGTAQVSRSHDPLSSSYTFTFDYLKGETGEEGVGIDSIEKTGTSGLVDTYTITFTDATTTTFTVTNGANGADGKGILSISKTGTSGLVDTYTITFTDNTTTNYSVTNGNGIASIQKTGTSGLVDTYTITFDNGATTTFQVTNGTMSATQFGYANTHLAYEDYYSEHTGNKGVQVDIPSASLPLNAFIAYDDPNASVFTVLYWARTADDKVTVYVNQSTGTSSDDTVRIYVQYVSLS